jgi:hypothetical protein
LSNIKDANIVFTAFTTQAQLPEFSPLLNFVKFLLQTVERDAAPLFLMLREKYSLSIKRDETFNKVSTLFRVN